VAGVVIGRWLGSGLIELYNAFFRFPSLAYQLSWGVAASSVAGSLAAGALGAQAAVRRAVRVPPAEAMRPEPPGRYRRSVVESAWLRHRLTHATRMVLRNVERQPARAMASITGLAMAVAILVVGFSFLDMVDVLIDQQFVQTIRYDAAVTFVEPRSGRVRHDLRHLPGVLTVESTRVVPARLRAGHRMRTLAISGVPSMPELSRVLDRERGPLAVPADGLLISTMLARILDVRPGDRIHVEVLEGRRPAADLPVVGLVDDSMGLQAYLEIGALRRFLREGDTVSGASLTVDPAQVGRLYAELKLVPAVAGVALRELALANFRDTLAQNMNISVFFNVLFSCVIAFGVVYNSARVSLSERARELASLRVLGFSRLEISLILLGELALLTLVSLPVGGFIGYLLGTLIISSFNNEVYRMPFVFTMRTLAWTFLTVVFAAVVSGLLVRRRLDRLDLIGVLKTRE
jgi:putative ABC transport system permease protein